MRLRIVRGEMVTEFAESDGREDYFFDKASDMAQRLLPAPARTR